jgi:hypothetical protein
MRFVLSWLLYGLGCAFGWLLNAPIIGPLAYRPYNTLMLASADVQGKSNIGPWGALPTPQPSDEVDG